MALLRLIVRRLAAQRLLALALLVTMAFTVGVLVAGPIYADGSGRAIIDGVVRRSLVDQRNVRLTVTSGPRFDAGAADRTVRAVVARNVPTRQVVTQATSQAVSVTSPSGVRRSTELAFRTNGFDHLTLEGRPPRADDEAVVSNGDALNYKIEAGDTLTVRSAGGVLQLRITGLYNLPASSDPAWYGLDSIFNRLPPTQPAEPLLVTGPGFARALDALGLSSGQQYTWDVYLDLARTDLAGLEAAARGAGRTEAALRGTGPLAFLTMRTGLPDVLRLARSRVGDARAPIYLVVFQIAAVALAVLAGVSSLALSRQSFELAVLKSRGFTRWQLLAAQGVESLLAAAGALPLGLLLGLVMARLARAAHGPVQAGSVFPVDMGPEAVFVGVAGALVAAALLLLTSVPHLLRTVLEERQNASRERRPALARFPLEVLAGALGAVAYWEVRRRGLGALARTGSIDPLVLLAPTLLLFAASFAGLRAVLWGFRRMDGLIGRLRLLPAYLAGRRLARSPSTIFATVLLLLLATGLLVVSSSYRDTILTNHADVAHQQLGADWTVATAPARQSLAVANRLPAGFTPLYRGLIDSIDTTAIDSLNLDQAAAASALASSSVVALDTSTYPQGGWWRPDYSGQPLPELLGRLSVPDAGIALPPGTRALQVEVATDVDASGLELVAAVQDRGGTVRQVSAGRLRTGAASYRAEAPGAVRLLSLSLLKLPSSPYAPPALGLGVTSIVAETGAAAVPVRAPRWSPLEWLSSGGAIRQGRAGAFTARLTSGGGIAAAGVIPAAPTLPALGSSDLAPLQGRPIHVAVCGMGMTVRVTGLVPRFPGVAPGSFLLLPLRPLLGRLESVPDGCGGITEVRAMGGSNPAPAVRSAGLPVLGTRDARDIEAVLSQDPQTLALGMHFAAAAGGMALVVVGVAVSLYFGQRRRQFEFAALRAMGAERRQLLGALLGEQAFLVAFALAAALGLGYVLLRMILPYAARNLSSAVPPGLLVVDWTALGTFAAAVVAATAIGIALGVRALFASSVPSVLRGEAE
jgi:predicted lysophospholipase L1 biosynthesis ABC-type transport system permease subunit